MIAAKLKTFNSLKRQELEFVPRWGGRPGRTTPGSVQGGPLPLMSRTVTSAQLSAQRTLLNLPGERWSSDLHAPRLAGWGQGLLPVPEPTCLSYRAAGRSSRERPDPSWGKRRYRDAAFTNTPHLFMHLDAFASSVPSIPFITLKCRVRCTSVNSREAGKGRCFALCEARTTVVTTTVVTEAFYCKAE